MIRKVSLARQGRLLPVCRVKRCRSIATETLSRREGTPPFFCQKCLKRLLELK